MTWAVPRGRVESTGVGEVEAGLLAGVSIFRWLAWTWMVATFAATRDRLEHPLVTASLIGVALVVTGVGSWSARRDLQLLWLRVLYGTEVAVSAALLTADRWVWGDDPGPRVASAWPLAGVLASGVLFGPVWGVAGGAFLGLANGLGGGPPAVPMPDRTLSIASTTVFYCFAGLVSGLVTDRLRRAERRVAAAEAREEVARTLHDGVLQTLAVVQRRSTDPELSTLARAQERDLRLYLFGAASDSNDLGTALRHAVARFEDTYGARAEVVLTDADAKVDSAVIDAVAAAVKEALTNAAKHGGARRVTVFADVEGGELFCSVKDDGAGFDVASVEEGVGLARSIRGRMEAMGGHAEIVSTPGRGTEVRLRAPTKERRG